MTDDVDPGEIVEAALASGEDDVETFVNRHGREGLERAAEYVIEYVEGGVNHRIAAREQDWSPLETATILEALVEVSGLRGDRGDVRFEDVLEAEAALRARGISDEVIDEIHTPVWVAAEEILRQHDFEDHIDIHSLARTLEIGTIEVMVLALDAGVIDEDGVRELASAINDDPLDEIRVVVGRMLGRDPDMQEVVAALQRRRMTGG